jgi:uncharacterized protein YbaR (Trm112 family)
MILLLKCPNCKNNMKYMPLKTGVIGKSKKCVYCGKNYNVRDNILKKLE